MATRYFKSTDGKITTFRATKTRAYQSANVTMRSFSEKHPGPGTFPTSEITKAEYDALQAAKIERITSEGGRLDWANDPAKSWVFGSY